MVNCLRILTQVQQATQDQIVHILWAGLELDKGSYLVAYLLFHT